METHVYLCVLVVWDRPPKCMNSCSVTFWGRALNVSPWQSLHVRSPVHEEKWKNLWPQPPSNTFRINWNADCEPGLIAQHQWHTSLSDSKIRWKAWNQSSGSCSCCSFFSFAPCSFFNFLLFLSSGLGPQVHSVLLEFFLSLYFFFIWWIFDLTELNERPD